MQKDAHSEAFKSKWVPFKQRDLAGIFGVVISTFSHTDLWSISFILGPGNSRYTRMGTTSCFSLETSHQIITACHRGEQAPLGWQLFGSPVRSEVVFFDAKKPLKQTHRHTHTHTKTRNLSIWWSRRIENPDTNKDTNYMICTISYYSRYQEYETEMHWVTSTHQRTVVLSACSCKE